MHGSSRHAAPRPAPAGRRATAAAAAADTEQLSGLLEPAVTAMGMDLEGVRVTSAGRRRLLRVVVDCDGGVSLDAIALVSRELSARLDAVAAMGETPYTLEVSSPGVDRPLTEPRHWRRAAGRLVIAPLTSQPQGETGSLAAPATIEGRVTGADDHGIQMEVDGQARQFGYADLGPGRIQVEFARLPALSAENAGQGQGADEEDSDGY
jgi:ribosome maturation factor RimP